MVLTFDSDYFATFDDTEYTWSSSTPSSIPDWPCPDSVPSFYPKYKRPESPLILELSTNLDEEIILADLISSAPTFRLVSLPENGDVALYTFELKIGLYPFHNGSAKEDYL